MIIIIQQINLLILYPHICFYLQITQPSTRIRDSRKTLTDNIFSNTFKENTISGNLAITISDHLPQLITLSNIFSNLLSKKSSIYERHWSNFVQENFILDYISVDWNSIFNDDTNNFVKKIITILDNHAPLRKVTRRNKDLDLSRG